MAMRIDCFAAKVSQAELTSLAPALHIDLQNIEVPDRQLACCRIESPSGRRYLSAMKCAANYAFVNRSLMARYRHAIV